MRDDPASLDFQEPEDDTLLSVEPLHGPQDGIGARLLERVSHAFEAHPGLGRRLSLGMLGALLLAITVTVWRPPLAALLLPANFPTLTTTSGWYSSATIQIATPIISPGTGWTPAGPSEAQLIVFAPSAPAIAYTCGAPELSSLYDPVPIAVRVSSDYGHTWQLSKTPATGVQCDLTVNPTDPADVALAATSVSLDNTATPPSAKLSALALYRSFDGGVTWQPWPLPADAGGQAAHFIWYFWAWAGATLFVAPYAAGETGYTRLAASVHRQPFAWVRQYGLFAGMPSDASIIGIFGSQATLYVDLHTSECADDCFRTIRTRDSGASWSQFTGQFQGQRVYPLSDGRSLFGVVADPTDQTGEARTYVHSEDDGATWRPLVAPPQHLVISQVVQTPDGAIYAGLYLFPGKSVAQPGVYALPPGATSWRFVAPYPGDQGSFTITWNDQGHALALWGGATYSTSAYPQIGLETHTP